MSDPLLVPPLSIDAPRLSDDEIIAKLNDASAVVHAEYTEWWRGQQCLLKIAAIRLAIAQKRYEAARKVNDLMRQRLNEARSGVVKAGWWYDASDPESSYSDPSEILCEIDPGEIVEMKGAAEVEATFGFRLGPAPDAESDDDREFWFPTKDEAVAKLAELRAADAAAAANLAAAYEDDGDMYGIVVAIFALPIPEIKP